MEERIKQNIKRIEELTNELVEIYHERAGQREKENVDRIHAEIKTRTILDKLYTNIELSQSNLLSLYKYVFEINNKKNDYDSVYNTSEKNMLLNCYEMYEKEINEIIENRNKSNQQKNIFSKIRKKVINSHGR